MGIGQTFIDFIKILYKDNQESTITNNGSLSKPIQMQRGRQDAPFSFLYMQFKVKSPQLI